MVMARTLIVAPLHNTHGKRDADEFTREAQAFGRTRGLRDAVQLVNCQQPASERREHVHRVLDEMPAGSLETVALFCHGWPTGIQLGYSCRDAWVLAMHMRRAAAHELRVILYACSAGADDDGDTEDEVVPGPGGDGGFADALRDQLCDRGTRATVYAHTCKGHATRNPWVRRFPPEMRAGGHMLVEPRSPLFPAWRRSLSGGMRFRFPWLTPEDLTATLEAPPGVA